MAAIFYTLATLKDRLGAKERGATAVEYGIMVAAIAIAVIIVVFALGDQLNELFQNVSDKIEAETGAGSGS